MPALRAGFSLLELIAVMLILSAISAVAVPMITSLTGLQTHSARATLFAALAFSQANAGATGTPTGVRIDLAGQTYRFLQVQDPGPGVEPLLDPLGAPSASSRVSRASRAIVDRVEGKDLSTTEPTVWFGYLGSPERRDADGALISPAADVTRIVLEQGDPILVHPITGVIE